VEKALERQREVGICATIRGWGRPRSAADGTSLMYDPPAGMPARVERLLQVLAVLRASELPVRRGTLVSKVDDYRQGRELAEATASVPAREKAVEALHKKVNLDLKQLRDLGFAITDNGRDGARVGLRPAPCAVAASRGAGGRRRDAAGLAARVDVTGRR
jgi:hypothetical protein